MLIILFSYFEYSSIIFSFQLRINYIIEIYSIKKTVNDELIITSPEHPQEQKNTALPNLKRILYYLQKVKIKLRIKRKVVVVDLILSLILFFFFFFYPVMSHVAWLKPKNILV